LETRSGPTKVYWGLLVLAVILTALLTYSIASPSSTQHSTTNSQQAQSLIGLLQSENLALQRQLAAAQSSVNSTVGLDPVAIYAKTSMSVVTVQGLQASSSGSQQVLGSGFVIKPLGDYYIVTNFHVVQNDTDITVTFSNGDAYPAKVVGTDPYSDLAVLNASAPPNEFHPLTIASSGSLKVGEPLVAIGNPFGLSGSMTFGITSQLGRTITESLAGNFPIADVIQLSAPINPGNSGGPLIDANGSVIGITTATIGSSQGVGFAIPSDTLLRELPPLIATGSYTMHSYMGIESVDMNYQLAQLEGTNVTYGALVQSVVAGGPAANAGLKGGSRSETVQGSQYSIGGDIIVAINGTRLVNTDALSTYLEGQTVPGQTLVLGIIRGGHFMTIDMVLGTRPPPPSG
jgi:S1-C subfamily serine protease